jgi:hypothetical protein
MEINVKRNSNQIIWMKEKKVFDIYQMNNIVWLRTNNCIKSTLTAAAMHIIDWQID